LALAPGGLHSEVTDWIQRGRQSWIKIKSKSKITIKIKRKIRIRITMTMTSNSVAGKPTTTAEPPTSPRPRLPDWLRIKLPTTERFAQTRSLLGELRLHTVCESAQCPNHWECWSRGTATFMIAGDRCTRACGFCAVDTAKPLPLDPDDPRHPCHDPRYAKLRPEQLPAAECLRDTLERVLPAWKERSMRSVSRNYSHLSLEQRERIDHALGQHDVCGSHRDGRFLGRVSFRGRR